ncbi:MAG TPA: pirin family protein, partial [Hanamia sp.]|nr:pirin family protein [Hanamia sp.]
LFLNHHGYQVYPKNNYGLPFGPHPHRGFETVTFIVHGDLTHKDSGGSESVIKAGGVQWMTAGRGLIHSELSSDEFMRNGGDLEILQLWVNLPKRLKMTEPKYIGLQENQIPKVELDNGKVTVHAVSGNWHGTKGAFDPLVDIQLATIQLQKEGNYRTRIDEKRNIFFYVIKGKVWVNGKEAEMHQLVEFGNEGTEVDIKAQEESTLLFGHAEPFNEPIVAQGPFVMNTREEIRQAFHDYRSGKFES